MHLRRRERAVKAIHVFIKVCDDVELYLMVMEFRTQFRPSGIAYDMH
jgi:hypothetical protein